VQCGIDAMFASRGSSNATAEYRVLAPLAIREIVYRVLTGA
jgi:hypothetical protein